VLGPPTLVEQFDDLVSVVRLDNGARARVVIVGRDVDFTYERLRIAADAIRGGADFLALNWDPMMPVEGGGIVPGTGAVVAALEAASGKKSTVLGKPELPMMQTAAEILGAEPVLMIGDRLEADIAGARRMGWDGALVLTGLTKVPSGDPSPNYLLASLGALASLPEGLRVSEEA
jgi:HAD superfamily hydrolase (TIGR01450 family)